MVGAICLAVLAIATARPQQPNRTAIAPPSAPPDPPLTPPASQPSTPHRFAGSVFRLTGNDSVPLGRTRVVLHRVTTGQSGPIDSTLTDGRGHFEIRAAVDTGAVYLVSARYRSIEYFSAPTTAIGKVDLGLIVTVSDTSSITPVLLAARHLIVSPIDSVGMRNVVDLAVVDNPGSMTRVSSDSQHPTWRVVLPPLAVNVHGGESDFSLSAFVVDGDTVELFAAIPPGRRNIELDYQIPPRASPVVVPVDESAARSNIVSQDKSLAVTPGYARSDTTIGGKAYTRWQGSMTAGVPVVLTFDIGGTPSWVIPALVVVMAVVLVGVTVGARGKQANR